MARRIVYQQWFLNVFLGPFSNVNDRIMPMSEAVSSEVPKTTGILQKSLALFHMHRDFSSFSESFDYVIYCRLWNSQSLCNLMLRNVEFKLFHNLFTHSFTDWSAPAHLYFWETLFSKTSLLLLIMLQTWCQLTELVSRGSPSWIFSNSLVIQPFVAPVPNLFYL